MHLREQLGSALQRECEARKVARFRSMFRNGDYAQIGSNPNSPVPTLRGASVLALELEVEELFAEGAVWTFEPYDESRAINKGPA